MPQNYNYKETASGLPTRFIKLADYIAYFLKPFLWPLGILVGLVLVSGFHGFVNSYFTKVIIDRLPLIEGSGEYWKSVFWPIIFIVVGFELHSLCWRGVGYINLKTAPVMKNNMIMQGFEYLHHHSIKFFQDHLSGSIGSNIHMLAENMERLVYIYAPPILRAVVQLGVALVSMYFVSPFFALALGLWVGVFLAVSLMFSKRIHYYADGYASAQSKVCGKVVDSISNYSNVKIFNRIGYEKSYLEKFLIGMKKRYEGKEWFLLKFHLAQGISITVLIGFMAWMLVELRIKGKVTVGDFAFILGLTLYVTESIWWVTEQIDLSNDAIGRCKQSIKDLYQRVEIEDVGRGGELKVTEGRIVFESVRFHYPNTEPLFQNKSVKILPKQKVGLVGYSGGGKSTFVNLILRLYDVTSGRILIDGQDIKEVRQGSLREKIGIIPQEPVFFHRSLMENIRYAKLEATDEEVIEAAKKAHAHEFIASLPDHYHTLVGERGTKLSGGQRQRLAIARVILKNAPILILDEATSQLDSATELLIQDALDRVMKDKTVLVVAHRLSTLLNMDRILVFDGGKIVGDGAHEKLIGVPGLYQELWNAQVQGFIQDDKNEVED